MTQYTEEMRNKANECSENIVLICSLPNWKKIKRSTQHPPIDGTIYGILNCLSHENGPISISQLIEAIEYVCGKTFFVPKYVKSLFFTDKL